MLLQVSFSPKDNFLGREVKMLKLPGHEKISFEICIINHSDISESKFRFKNTVLLVCLRYCVRKRLLQIERQLPPNYTPWIILVSAELKL